MKKCMKRVVHSQSNTTKYKTIILQIRNKARFTKPRQRGAIGIKKRLIINSIIIVYFLILRNIKYSTNKNNTPAKAGFVCVQIASGVNVPVLL